MLLKSQEIILIYIHASFSLAHEQECTLSIAGQGCAAKHLASVFLNI